MRCTPRARDDAARRGLNGRAARGYTLLELVIVTSILAVLAAVAVPSLNPSRTESLDLAAQTVADALRFAQAEAMRTGDVHLVEINRDSESVRVALADISGPDAVPVADLVHPITKQPYNFVLSDQPGLGGIELGARPFDYGSGANIEFVLFDARGLPFWKSSDSLQLLELGEIELEIAEVERSVFVAPLTGRVTFE